MILIEAQQSKVTDIQTYIYMKVILFCINKLSFEQFQV